MFRVRNFHSEHGGEPGLEREAECDQRPCYTAALLALPSTGIAPGLMPSATDPWALCQ